MKNILSSITQEEKNRILEMHKRAISKNYLTEQLTGDTTGQAVGGGKKVDVGTTLDNGFNIKNFDTRALDTQSIVFVQTEDNGMGQNFSCQKHEAGKYSLSPKGVLTQAESQALYDKFCKKGVEQPTTPTTGQAVGGGMKIDTGTEFANGLKIIDQSKTNVRKGQDGSTIVWLQTQETGAGNEFSCKRHENGKYILWPTGNGKNTLTQEESQALYDKYCKK